MLKTLNWHTIKEIHQRILNDYKLDPETAVSFHFTIDHGETFTRRFRFKQFLEAMWRLFDNYKIFTKIKVSRIDNGEVIYLYELNKVDENKPVGGNGDLILNFKNMTAGARNVHIDLLMHQILEDNTCIQNNGKN